jgi:hypothetical protein
MAAIFELGRDPYFCALCTTNRWCMRALKMSQCGSSGLQITIEEDHLQIWVLPKVCKLAFIQRWTFGISFKLGLVSTFQWGVISLRKNFTSYYGFSRFWYIFWTFLPWAALLKPLADPDSNWLVSCEYPSFSPGFWGFLEGSSFARTFHH